MHSYCKNWVLLLNRWPFNVKCFGENKNNIYPKAVLPQNGTKIQKKSSILGRNCRVLIHLFLPYFFIFRALSIIRHVCNIESRAGNLVLYSIRFNRIIVWMMNYKKYQWIRTEGRHRITLFLLSKEIFFWNSRLRYLSFSFIRPTLSNIFEMVPNSG